MEFDQLEKEQRRRIFMAIKPYFKDKLGKYTHQRISDEWHFHGLGFVRDEMTYVFGINIGFFKLETIPHIEYSHVGMNVLVRTNGLNQELRMKYRDFFRKNLKNWTMGEEKTYTSFRGGVGSEFPRYKPLQDFKSDEQILDFLKEGIDGLHQLYPLIAENKDSIFSHVVRAAPPWHDTLIQLCFDCMETSQQQE